MRSCSAAVFDGAFHARLDCFASLAMTRKFFVRACVRAGVQPMKQPAVYIVANRRNGTLYTGVTSNLAQRAHQHREGSVRGFSARYGCKVLVWYEAHDEMYAAITREKQLKAGSRKRKLALIEELNPEWKDLYETLI
jgi:predicted GIY-YIG superfamily endonuclease